MVPTDQMTERRAFKAAEVADMLGVHVATVRRWIKTGTLRATRVDPKNPREPYRIPASEVDRITTAARGRGRPRKT